MRIISAAVAFALGAAAIAGIVQAAGTAFPQPPPLPKPSPVTETFFGTAVTDRYRYFEDMQNPVTVQFFKEQNAYTRAVLARLGAPRQKLYERIAQLDNAGTSVSGLTVDGDRYFYEKLKPGDNSEKLYASNLDGSGEKLLVDPDKLATAGKHYTINYFTPSLDGKYVAYGISEGGSEASVIRVVETATGQVLADAIDRAYFVGVTSWLPDNSFYYVRFPQLKPGEPETDKETRPVNYLHVIGRDPDKDAPIFGYDVNPAVKFAPTDFPIVEYSPASPQGLGVIAHGVKNEVEIYTAPAASMTSSAIAWKPVAADSDDVTGFDIKGSTIYLLTHHDAPSYKVVATSLVAPNLATAQTVIPAGRQIALQVSVAQDGLYVRSREGGFGGITKVLLSADGAPGAQSVVNLPYSGSINLMSTDPRVDGAVFGLTGWTHSLLYYRVNAVGVVVDTRVKQLSPVDESAYMSYEVEARSADGTMVPMSLIYRRGLKLDGSHPVDLEGYGSYGITIEPAFSTTRVAWMERGGVEAVCHVRGGGWFGEAWHQAGMIATKHHTWEDFIGCAQWLIAHKYSSPAHMSGQGTSAGGITIGRAITSRPDLFAAALDVVGVSNALRSEFSPNGPPNIPEFGTVKDEAGFRALYTMDAYQHVRNGTAYPAVMAITGFNDPRVPSWELAKFVARLQRASTSGKPVLLRVDYDAGHGFLAASRAQSEQLLADQYAFSLWQLGDPAFAGIPKRIVERK